MNDTVNDTCFSRFALLAMTSILLVACEAPPAPPTPEKTGDYNRMERVLYPGIDSVYRKQYLDLSAYAKVLVAPPTVAFRENWRPEDDPTLARIGVPDPAAGKRARIAAVSADSVDKAGGKCRL